MAKKKKKSAPKKEKKVKVKRKKGGETPYYSLEGDKVVRNKVECPRCTKGVFMASHYNRRSCGKCGFTQFLDKSGNVRGSTGRGRKRRSRRTRRTSSR